MERTEWYKNAIVYQIYPFSFMDANNDGWGDIEGILSRLDYLKELGIDAIWFSPLYKSPCKDYGYDIADYKDIDPKFGTLADFDRLVAECHARGIRVIMDMAINHSSTEHPWFRAAAADPESPYRDYYLIRKGIRRGKKLLPPTNWDSTFTGSAWERLEGSDEFYLHLFCVEQADLNWENPAVREEAASVFNFWLERGVDGFRLDVFNMFSKVHPFRNDRGLIGKGGRYYIDGPRMHEFLRELNERAFSRFDCYTVGESYKPHPEDAAAYVKAENRELDTIFNFAHLTSDQSFGVQFFPGRFRLRVFKEGLFGPQRASFGQGWNTLVLENHDNARSNSRFGIDEARFHYEASTFLPTVTFLGFGTPFIYMGEEFGMANVPFRSVDEMKDPVSHFIYDLLTKYGVPRKLAFRFVMNGARDHARVPMQWNGKTNAGFNEGAEPWQCVSPRYTEINLEKDLASDASVFRYYQKLIALKKSSDAAVNGTLTEYARRSRRIIAFSRETAEEKLFVVGNFSAKTANYTLPVTPSALVLSNYEDADAAAGRITLRPYEARVYRF